MIQSLSPLRALLLIALAAAVLLLILFMVTSLGPTYHSPPPTPAH